MRIALVSQEYPPETAKGGIGTQTYARAHGLAALGHEIVVVSQSKDSEEHFSRQGAVEVRRIPGFEFRFSLQTELAQWVTYSIDVAAAVAKLHAEKPLDLAVFPEWGCEGYVHLLNRTEWNRVPTLVHIHGPLIMFAHTMGWPEIGSEFYRLGTAMEGTCLRLADAISASSQCSAEWCAKSYGLDLARIRKLHPGIDTKTFSPDGTHKAARPTILFVGSIVPNKGVRRLVEAGCELAREFPALRLKFIGRGEENLIIELRHVANDCGFPALLEFAGYVNREDLPEHYREAHVFAGPSQYEGGPGNVYLEAMACGVPVVACSGSGASETIQHGQTGLLVPPEDARELASSLRSLLADSPRRQVMAENGRRYVLEKANSQVCLQEISEFYCSVSDRAQAAGMKP